MKRRTSYALPIAASAFACLWSGRVCTGFSTPPHSLRHRNQGSSAHNSASDGSNILLQKLGSRRCFVQEAGRQGENFSSDRLDFVRDAAVSLAGGSAVVFGGAHGAWAVGGMPGERESAPPNPLLLVPALRAKLAVQGLLKLLQDPKKWDQARDALNAAPLTTADFKTCFRTYSDADPEQHLAFDLYRIQAQDALKAVSELLAYFASEKNKGASILTEDVQDLEEAGRSVLQGIDDFLSLAPREDVLMVEKNTKQEAATSAARPTTNREGRALEGAVAGEGAFVARTWVDK